MRTLAALDHRLPHSSRNLVMKQGFLWGVRRNCRNAEYTPSILGRWPRGNHLFSDVVENLRPIRLFAKRGPSPLTRCERDENNKRYRPENADTAFSALTAARA